MWIQRIMRTKTINFYTISDGLKRTYTNDDHIHGYGTNYIPNPKSVSVINVYVNGVLQLSRTYRVTTGKIRFKTIDVPPKGTPIIFHSIRIYGWKGGGKCTRKPKRCPDRCGTKTHKHKKHPVKHGKSQKRSVKQDTKLTREESFMALSLIKLQVSATTDTTTTAGPAQPKFFYQNPSDVASGSDLTIDAAAFTDDTGAAATALPALATDDSYFKVYINGMVQENGDSTYTPGATGVGSLVFANPAGGGTIYANQWLVLEVTNFAPTSTSATTVET